MQSAPWRRSGNGGSDEWNCMSRLPTARKKIASALSERGTAMLELNGGQRLSENIPGNARERECGSRYCAKLPIDLLVAFV